MRLYICDCLFMFVSFMVVTLIYILMYNLITCLNTKSASSVQTWETIFTGSKLVLWSTYVKKGFLWHFCDIHLYRNTKQTTSWERLNIEEIFERRFREDLFYLRNSRVIGIAANITCQLQGIWFQAALKTHCCHLSFQSVAASTEPSKVRQHWFEQQGLKTHEDAVWNV